MARFIFRLSVVIGCVLGVPIFFLMANLGARTDLNPTNVPTPGPALIMALLVAGVVIAIGSGLAWAVRAFEE
jgi:hypothetical protein